MSNVYLSFALLAKPLGPAEGVANGQYDYDSLQVDEEKCHFEDEEDWVLY